MPGASQTANLWRNVIIKSRSWLEILISDSKSKWGAGWVRLGRTRGKGDQKARRNGEVCTCKNPKETQSAVHAGELIGWTELNYCCCWLLDLLSGQDDLQSDWLSGTLSWCALHTATLSYIKPTTKRKSKTSLCVFKLRCKTYVQKHEKRCNIPD